MDSVTLFFARYVIYLALLGWFIYLLRRPPSERVKLALAGVVGVLVAFGLIKLLGLLWYDARPFVGSGIQPLFAHGADNGFPSDHATVLGLAAGLLWPYSRRLGAGFLLIGLLVGWARLVAHVHHGPDIAVGLLAGLLAAWVGTALAPRLIALRDRGRR